MHWNDETTGVLRRCAAAGKTFAETAAAIGGDCTRNMVAGKARRLGVTFSADLKSKLSTIGRIGAAKRWADPAFRAREQERRRAARAHHAG